MANTEKTANAQRIMAVVGIAVTVERDKNFGSRVALVSVAGEKKVCHLRWTTI